MNAYVQIDKRYQWGFFILCGGIFLFFPVLGIITATLFAIKTRSNQLILFMLWLLVMYFSALNTTKVPAGDMEAYLDMFNSVPRNGYYRTLEYLSFNAAIVKDVGYASLVYLLYYIYGGNQYLFIFTISVVTFLPFFMAIYKFGVEYEQPKYLIVAELLVIAFFSQYFSLTFHLVRQELATSLFFYALTYRHSSIRNFIIWGIVAASIHSSIIAIIIIAIIPFMTQELTMKEIVILVVGALSFLFILSYFGSFLMDNYELEGSIEYGVSRMADAEGAQDETKGSSSIVYVFSGLMVLLSVWEMFVNRGSVTYPLVVNLCFFWSVLVLGLFGSPLLQYRLFFIEYNFIPFIIFLVFRNNPLLLKMVCFCLVIFLVFRFYSGLNKVFQYVSIEDAMTLSFISLIKI